MKMDTEFEAKFYPINKGQIRKRIEKLGGSLVIPERKMRRTIADRFNNSWMKQAHLRIRDEGNLVRLSAKRNAGEKGKLTDQKEIQVEVSSYKETYRLLKSVGIKFNYYVETLRETWDIDKAEICIDTWPGLEPRLEIEADSEKAVKKVAEKLGFDWSEKIITAMPETYAKVYGIRVREVLKMMSNLTFENNPFKKLTKKSFKY